MRQKSNVPGRTHLHERHSAAGRAGGRRLGKTCGSVRAAGVRCSAKAAALPAGGVHTRQCSLLEVAWQTDWPRCGHGGKGAFHSAPWAPTSWAGGRGADPPGCRTLCEGDLLRCHALLRGSEKPWWQREILAGRFQFGIFDGITFP